MFKTVQRTPQATNKINYEFLTMKEIWEKKFKM